MRCHRDSDGAKQGSRCWPWALDGAGGHQGNRRGVWAHPCASGFWFHSGANWNVFVDLVFGDLLFLLNYSKVKEGGNGLSLWCAGTCWDSWGGLCRARSGILMLLVGPFQFRKFNEPMIAKTNLFSEGAQQVLFCSSTVPCCSQTQDVLQYSMWWHLYNWIDFHIVASWNPFLSSSLISWGNFHPLDSLNMPEPQAGLCRECEMWCGQAQLGLPVTRATNPVLFPAKIPFQDFKWGVLLWTGLFQIFSDVKEL